MLEQAPRKDPPTAGATPATLAGLLRSWVRVWGSLRKALGFQHRCSPRWAPPVTGTGLGEAGGGRGLVSAGGSVPGGFRLPWSFPADGLDDPQRSLPTPTIL